MKNKINILFFVITMLCAFTATIQAAPDNSVATIFLDELSNARTIQALVVVNEIPAGQEFGTVDSTRYLLYADFENAVFSLDSLDNAHSRYVYRNNKLVHSLHMKREDKQLYSNQPLNPYNSVREIEGSVSGVLEKVVRWLLRHPSRFITMEAPNQFGIKDGGWAKLWSHLVIPTSDYHFFMGFINTGLASVFVANKENKLTHTVQIIDIHFNRNIAPEKFTIFRNHPLAEIPLSPSEDWWQEALQTKMGQH